MYEYEIVILVEDKEKNQHKIKRYYVLSITGRYQLKDEIEKRLKVDPEIKQYKLINYSVINWYHVSQ